MAQDDLPDEIIDMLPDDVGRWLRILFWAYGLLASGIPKLDGNGRWVALFDATPGNYRVSFHRVLPESPFWELAQKRTRIITLKAHAATITTGE